MKKHLLASFVLMLLTAFSSANGDPEQTMMPNNTTVTPHHALMHFLRTTNVDEVAWDNLPVEEAVESLMAKSTANDPEHKGVVFRFNAVKGARPSGQLAQTVTLHLSNTSLLNVTKALADKIACEFAVGDKSVDFIDRRGGEGLILKTISVPQLPFGLDPSEKVPGSATQYNINGVLANHSIPTAPGSAAVYDLQTKKLTVITDSYSTLEQIDELLNP
jgi:hypothetical protein